MTALRFEWDRDKASANEQKHGVPFDEASTVFLDEEALLMADPDHSEDEQRFLILGWSARLRMLVVCHCVEEEDEVIRLISARIATRNERGQYEDRVR